MNKLFLTLASVFALTASDVVTCTGDAATIAEMENIATSYSKDYINSDEWSKGTFSKQMVVTYAYKHKLKFSQAKNTFGWKYNECDTNDQCLEKIVEAINSDPATKNQSNIDKCFFATTIFQTNIGGKEIPYENGFYEMLYAACLEHYKQEHDNVKQNEKLDKLYILGRSYLNGFVYYQMLLNASNLHHLYSIMKNFDDAYEKLGNFIEQQVTKNRIAVTKVINLIKKQYNIDVTIQDVIKKIKSAYLQVQIDKNTTEIEDVPIENALRGSVLPVYAPENKRNASLSENLVLNNTLYTTGKCIKELKTININSNFETKIKIAKKNALFFIGFMIKNVRDISNDYEKIALEISNEIGEISRKSEGDINKVEVLIQQMLTNFTELSLWNKGLTGINEHFHQKDSNNIKHLEALSVFPIFNKCKRIEDLNCTADNNYILGKECSNLNEYVRILKCSFSEGLGLELKTNLQQEETLLKKLIKSNTDQLILEGNEDYCYYDTYYDDEDEDDD